MTRIAYAARTLLQQVGCDHSPTEGLEGAESGSGGLSGPIQGQCGVVGDPDGLGVHRTVMVGKDIDVSSDPRVKTQVTVSTELGDVTLVTVRSNRLGDLTYPFDL